MNKLLFILSFSVLTVTSFGQNPYAVSVPSKSVDKSPKDNRSDFVKRFKYLPIYEWTPGMKFMAEPDKYNVGFNLDLVPYKSRDEYSDRLRLKDFAYKIFTYKGLEQRKGSTYIEFECEGKVYEKQPFLGSGVDQMKKYEEEGNGFMNAIDHLIYLGEIDTAKAQLVGRKVWILKRLWMRDNEKGIGVYQSDGLQYYPVTISQIGAGDNDAPIRVVFKADIKDEAYIDVYLSGTNQKLRGLKNSFDDVFSFENPKEKYPKISEETWTLIQNGKAKIGMTDQECKLSWGEPNDINSTIIDGLVTEQWVYGDKSRSYLYFRNGQLTSIQD